MFGICLHRWGSVFVFYKVVHQSWNFSCVSTSMWIRPGRYKLLEEGSEGLTAEALSGQISLGKYTCQLGTEIVLQGNINARVE
jgi:hypothetical protein